MQWLHAARRVEAGKHDFVRDERCGLLRWAKEKEHGACDERRATEAALPATTAPRLLRHPRFRRTRFKGSKILKWE
jgi:hypothetical protein